MKQLTSLLTFFIIIATIFWGFSDVSPSLTLSDPHFSIENAKKHLKNISDAPHFVGTESHNNVQKYLFDELNKLGISPEIQTQTVVNNKWYAATTVQNIIVKIKGRKKGKALLLLSHYDSSPHSSLGASDAGSGVVVILEGIRSFLENNEQPKNDIIILISDAEELGLLGAKAFVEHHPLAKNVGLVLNFEARGSGGPSYMLMETNGKNGKMLSEFMSANPNYPAANSLMYSVYKRLPNDTDLTVFRENGNINGFNFAFIGDHFDYHTAQDSFDRLDEKTLIHQADYLTTLLRYFSNSDIENFSNDEDYVYVNFPFLKLLTYSYSVNLVLLILAFVGLFVLFFFGVALNKISIKGMLMGCVPFLISLVLCVAISFGLWRLIMIIHPQYQDILHGFTYNGYQYIWAFVLLNLWLLFKIYKKYFKNEKPSDLLVFPIIFWLILCVIIQLFLEGAAFFIIPVYAALIILGIIIFLDVPNKKRPLLFSIISIPTIYMFAPMVKMFPVGLGLKNIFISAIFLVLLFGVLIPVLYRPKFLIKITKIIGFATIILFLTATFNSGFSIDKKKPNSLVYIQNSEDKTAFFGTYNHTLDAFTKQIFDSNFEVEKPTNLATRSKYNTRFTYQKKTSFKGVETAKITIEKDTIIEGERSVNFTITPQRKINKIELSMRKDFVFKDLKINKIPIAKSELHYVKKERSFLRYHFSNVDATLSIEMRFDAKAPKPSILIKEISYDLLSSPSFSLKPRSKEMMPMPFVTNDAIICKYQLKL